MAVQESKGEQKRHGRKRASMSNGSTTWSFTYDADGMRTKRTNGSTIYSYTNNCSQLSHMSVVPNQALLMFFVLFSLEI